MADYASAMNMDGTWERLSNLGKIFEEAQKARALKEAYAGADFSNPQGLSALANRVGAVDPQRVLSIANLAQQHYLHSPEYITKTERAKAEVAQEFAPKTTDITLPSGEKLTVQKGPRGYEVPIVQGMPAPDPNLPPGVDPKTFRETRTKQLANIDDKAVLEADKNVQAGTSAIQSLQRALELSKTAFAGPLADKRGYVASLTGPGAGADTQELANVVTNQALETLRATFGGNPTEGERKILLDVQGAVSQSQDVRERIYQNAMRAVQQRTDFYRQTAEQMRSGKFLLPEAQRNAPVAGPSMPAPAPAANPTAWRTRENIMAARADQAGTLAQAKAAIAAGAPREVVIQRLQAAGINPAGL